MDYSGIAVAHTCRNVVPCIVLMTIDDYIDSHIDAEPDELRRLYRRTHIERLYPRMCTDHAQGRMLAMLTRMIRPHRILELGTFTGYSTLCFAEAMPDDCHIDTVELDDEYADDLLELFADRNITLHIGDAEELLPELLACNRYDMVFIDANKRRYEAYYRLVLPALPGGGYILADNTLWGGKVLDDGAQDPQTQGIRTFNDLIASDTAVEKVIIPVRDGLTLIRKR